MSDESNLSLLKRHDSDVIDILGRASHAVIYLLNQEDEVWSFVSFYVHCKPNDRLGKEKTLKVLSLSLNALPHQCLNF